MQAVAEAQQALKAAQAEAASTLEAARQEAQTALAALNAQLAASQAPCSFLQPVLTLIFLPEGYQVPMLCYTNLFKPIGPAAGGSQLQILQFRRTGPQSCSPGVAGKQAYCSEISFLQTAAQEASAQAQEELAAAGRAAQEAKDFATAEHSTLLQQLHAAGEVNAELEAKVARAAGALKAADELKEAR